MITNTEIATRGNQSPNHIVDFKQENDKIYFTTQNGVILQVTILRDSVVRFRYATEYVFEPDFSYAISEDVNLGYKWPRHRVNHSYSLDELLQLVNVLKGDMSLVGPRPLLVEYLPLYNEEQSKRHNVRPGITGWAQVNGRNTIDWNQKFKLDVWYVENISAMLDLKIIYKTFIKVVKKSDINQNENKTMPQWAGN